MDCAQETARTHRRPVPPPSRRDGPSGVRGLERGLADRLAARLADDALAVRVDLQVVAELPGSGGRSGSGDGERAGNSGDGEDLLQHFENLRVRSGPSAARTRTTGEAPEPRALNRKKSEDPLHPPSREERALGPRHARSAPHTYNGRGRRTSRGSL